MDQNSKGNVPPTSLMCIPSSIRVPPQSTAHGNPTQEKKEKKLDLTSWTFLAKDEFFKNVFVALLLFIIDDSPRTHTHELEWKRERSNTRQTSQHCGEAAYSVSRCSRGALQLPIFTLLPLKTQDIESKMHPLQPVCNRRQTCPALNGWCQQRHPETSVTSLTPSPPV